MTNKALRVIAAIDFGTTFSGFAYAHISSKEIVVHEEWDDSIGQFKHPTTLKYDDSLNLISWGYPALAEKPSKKKISSGMRPAERFKLCLGEIGEDITFAPYLPVGLDYETAITDYIKKMSNLIKDTLKTRWSEVDFDTQVSIIMTIPAEFDCKAIRTLRECALKAELVKDKDTPNLKFIQEPEAAAIHCMKSLKEFNVRAGSTFMVVDCGGGTVDLTTRKLLPGRRLCEKTISKGGYCGGIFVDEEFIKFLGTKIGQSTINLIREKHYSQLQYMVQEFSRRVKIPFTGESKDFKPFDLDLEVVKQYIRGSHRDELEEKEWVVELKFEDVKKMFDPVVEKILGLIRQQLDEYNDYVSAILLVGGFSESKYLQARVKQEFKQRVKNISVPRNPITAIVKGAVQYGLKNDVIVTRVLKWTYGTDVVRKWEPDDPPNQRLPGDLLIEFSILAKRGDEVAVDDAVPRVFRPASILQSRIGFDIFITDKDDDVKFFDTHDINLLGKWAIDIPVTFSIRPILFILCFGELEIDASAFNFETGETYNTTFELDI
ncbi:5241_t:CDS:2 [Funneliformis geosporum]|uniref:5241_t:CDS:1 n=1 Tax=Funneliformis geosporum TaxID=1117311 RepID=A0A9W4SLP5_9GLOM|nr:5241_t:CDS:2 [Funneliformis geosporum]